jgi:dipeptidyl aminopeptidase/acylaminoacyl peptidase
MDPQRPDSAKLVLEVKGGGWSVGDWSPDGTRLAVLHQVSINEASLHLLDLATVTLRPVHPASDTKAAYGEPHFTKDGTGLLFTSDRGSEFLQLIRRDLASGRETLLTPQTSWDVEGFELSPDAKTVAVVSNEDASSVLRLIDSTTGKPTGPQPRLPLGVITGLRWNEAGTELGFSLAHANAPSDAYSLDRKSGALTRWTRSETGGLDATRFRTPSVERTKSFDGRSISSLVYRPDPARFPGKRPVLVIIHGGPESQSRPVFQGRNNYHLDELGVALVYPNVRGSAGYGKTFLTLDNGFLREDSVKDIGAVLDWIKSQSEFDGARIGVTGGSYGGYMTLATLTHYSDRVKCGVDIVGISNFVTFLESTQEYRRDLRRVEYGDERDPAMRKHLLAISPSAQADRIRVPLMVVQGRNDPRVPVTESKQVVKAVRDAGGNCAYMEASDEGHGFQKKRNVDYQFFSTVEFWRKHLLGDSLP